MPLRQPLAGRAPLPEYDVVLVIPALGRSGGLRVLIEWANRLATSGRRVAVCAAARGPGTAELVPSVDVRAPRRMAHLLDEGAVRLLRRGRGASADLSIYPRAARRHLPPARRYVLGFAPWADVLGLSGNVLTYCQHWEPLWFEGSAPAQAAAERAMRRPGPKVVNSSWLKAHWPVDAQHELYLVYPGVDLDTFRTAGAAPVRSARLRVAALGRDDVPWKGLGELRQALTMSGLSAELLLFGTHGTRTTRTPWGRERALGGLRSSELADLYRSVDVVVTPSWFESFPLPPLEAMACGTPVITTREGTEDYAEDGVNALVVPGRDVPALSGALIRLEQDSSLGLRLREAGPMTAKRFTWAHGYSMFEAALEATA
jgi:glycosyltransferase involved in cell wall biosynthesis